MIDFKTILDGTPGIQHIIQGVKVGTDKDKDEINIFRYGTNVFTNKDGYIINNTRGINNYGRN